MGTVNGKLINQKINHFDELTQKTERINQRCEDLESQVIAITKHNYTQHLQKLNQEINSHKSYLQKLEQKIGFLEDVASRQAKQLFFLKISGVIALVSLWLIFGMNNQPEQSKTKPHRKAESLEFTQS
ncbi:hypothetical protein [Calothrix sp. PCC 6303]|uniref:hypothetical protein n=1 Tax=Calothrix sp. PCC 6303 TaxID=1170562 RepID=UPI0002A05843|nr:hypothetical protein [Calothrix sp. PCC 6303]AFZ01449.1 hypothetical protein Cal6303_2453 [Calothrix sp. PCC 6303]